MAWGGLSLCSRQAYDLVLNRIIIEVTTHSSKTKMERGEGTNNSSVYIYNGVDEVPRDVKRVRVESSVTVIPKRVFIAIIWKRWSCPKVW